MDLNVCMVRVVRYYSTYVEMLDCIRLYTAHTVQPEPHWMLHYL